MKRKEMNDGQMKMKMKHVLITHNKKKKSYPRFGYSVAKNAWKSW